MATNQQNVLDRGIVYAEGLDTTLRVLGHTQALSDKLHSQFTLTQVSTYPGHSPTPDRALDLFPASRAEGDRIAAWLTRPEVMEHYGITYVIWYQRIYNPSIAPYWRDMPDRGGTTANHKDHLHQSSNKTAPAVPQSQQEEDFLATLNDVEKDRLMRSVDSLLMQHDVEGIQVTTEWAAKIAMGTAIQNSRKIDEILAAMKSGSVGEVQSIEIDKLLDAFKERLED